MINQQISRIFNEIADLLEIKGENQFRIRAYRKAAQNIESLSKDVAQLTENELTGIPGIGKDLAGKIREFISTGAVKTHRELREDIPESLIMLLSIPGLGPKTAKLLHDKLNISSMDSLERLAHEHKLSGLPGIKDKTEKNILKGIEMIRRGKERQPIGKVLPLADEIRHRLLKTSPLKELEIAGSLRRWKDTIKDIDLLAVSDEPEKAMNAFVRLPLVDRILMRGPTKSSVITKDGIQVDLRVVEERSFGAAMAYFTGSKEHNIRLREMAVRAGIKINEYGIFRVKDNKRLGGEKEGDIYRLLGLPYIPPELREDNGEIEAAIEGSLPDLVEPEDIRGDLHVHTNYSDGSHSLEELAEAARKRGYEYIAITDHTKGLGVARGLNEEKIINELNAVRALNRKIRGFKLLMGVEVDIRSDYTLDLPDEILKQLDIVVASIHSGFRQGREQLTKRLISAVNNHYVTVIAHPTGRLIGERDAYDIDMESVLKTAAEKGRAIEINAYPLRLDINDIYAKRAKEIGVPIAISTDTHITSQFDYMRYGVSTARRGWLEKNDIINTYSIENLIKWIKRSRVTRGQHERKDTGL